MITPRIRSPENPFYTANYGVVKCYFWENIETYCSFDDTSDTTRTKITIHTPDTKIFKESEIPITVTTVGAKVGFVNGIPLYDIA